MYLKTICLQLKLPTIQRNTKRLHIKYLFVKEKIDEGIVIAVHIKSEDQIADVLTKTLSKNKFRKLFQQTTQLHYNSRKLIKDFQPT